MKRDFSLLPRPIRLLSKANSLLFLALCNALFLVLAIQATAGDKNHKSKDKSSSTLEVENFGKVNDHIFRGGQPEDSEYEQLAAIGIKTVIDLREDAKVKARRLTESAGMRYINLRLNAKVPPSPEESKLFLRLVNDQTNWPVYVHCAGGRHRTGVLVAVYRMEIDGWDARQAYNEMKEFKFYSSWGHGDMKDFVFDYFRQMAEARIQNVTFPITRPRRVSDLNQTGK